MELIRGLCRGVQGLSSAEVKLQLLRLREKLPASWSLDDSPGNSVFVQMVV